MNTMSYSNKNYNYFQQYTYLLLEENKIINIFLKVYLIFFSFSYTHAHIHTLNGKSFYSQSQNPAQIPQFLNIFPCTTSIIVRSKLRPYERHYFFYVLKNVLFQKCYCYDQYEWRPPSHCLDDLDNHHVDSDGQLQKNKTFQRLSRTSTIVYMLLARLQHSW